jgi:hypothetical protein
MGRITRARKNLLGRSHRRERERPTPFTGHTTGT